MRSNESSRPAIAASRSVVVITQSFFSSLGWDYEQAKSLPWISTISTGGAACSQYVARDVITTAFHFLLMPEKR
jgi:hypothetical protein